MKVTARETAIFAMLGAVMYASKIIMDMAPNIHLIGVFVIAITIVYRKKALYPIYSFVFLTGLLNGFSAWWVPYTYIWTLLWGATMLLPQKMSRKVSIIVYSVICSLHGFLYGILYVPAQALMFGLNFKQAVAWVIAGFPFDIIHGISNLALGLLIVPLSEILSKLATKYKR